MIKFDVLGKIGLDNCVAARVVTGTSTDYLFLDCGGNCFNAIPWTNLRDCSALFLSHFHFDHFAGFDEILRQTWCRDGLPVQIFGPPDTCRIIYHRLQGFLWNNAVGKPGEFRISEFNGQRLKTIRLLTTEKFAIIHEEQDVETNDVILSTDKYTVQAIILDHGTPCLGFRISEPTKQSINVDRMLAMQLRPGTWAAAVKDPSRPDSDIVHISNSPYRLGDLRTELLTVAQGDSLGYLTDFRVDDTETRARLVSLFRGTQTLICENNYRDQEQENARNTFHLTSSEVGQLAADINPEALVIFHVSDRYGQAQFQEQLDQIRQWFPNAAFPESWVPFVENFVPNHR